MARLKFTGFKERKLYKEISNYNNNYYYKLIDGKREGMVDFDIVSLMNSEFEEVKSKPKLTETQRKVLEARVLEGFRWIAKDKCGEIYAFRIKPRRPGQWWLEGTECNSQIYLEFDFLNWTDDEPTRIKELLEEE